MAKDKGIPCGLCAECVRVHCRGPIGGNKVSLPFGALLWPSWVPFYKGTGWGGGLNGGVLSAMRALCNYLGISPYYKPILCAPPPPPALSPLHCNKAKQ